MRTACNPYQDGCKAVLHRFALAKLNWCLRGVAHLGCCVSDTRSEEGTPRVYLVGARCSEEGAPRVYIMGAWSNCFDSLLHYVQFGHEKVFQNHADMRWFSKPMLIYKMVFKNICWVQTSCLCWCTCLHMYILHVSNVAGGDTWAAPAPSTHRRASCHGKNLADAHSISQVHVRLRRVGGRE